jgi:hypothetical protein
MKKLVLIAAAAVALAASVVTPASAGFKGCCGGWNPGGHHHHWHGGGGFGIGIGLIGDTGYGGDCYYVNRTVFVPGIGYVAKRQLVCE